jgi:nitrogen fixation NifU-like protein
MDELVLTADFSEPAAQWQRVVFLPFGSHREQLGLKQFPESPSSLPSAFAIDVDGSIWIADRWKSRLAHFSAAGAYLGEIPLGPGIRTEDLAMQGPDLLVITRVANGHNPLCGDKLRLCLRLDGDRIADIAFEGSGCAISKASASLMTDAVKGQTIDDATRLFDKFHQIVTTPIDQPIDEASVGKLAVLAGVREFPARVKCASLAWHTLKAALAGKDVARTE